MRDGLRCDMAMLMTNEVFARTWGERAGDPAVRGFLADADRARQARRGPTWCSSPRPTGTWSGRCSSRALTTATTSACTTAWCTNRRRGGARSPVQADRRLPGASDPLHREPRRARGAPPPSRPGDRPGRRPSSFSTLEGARLFHDGQLDGLRTHDPGVPEPRARRAGRFRRCAASTSACWQAMP